MNRRGVERINVVVERVLTSIVKSHRLACVECQALTVKRDLVDGQCPECRGKFAKYISAGGSIK